MVADDQILMMYVPLTKPIWYSFSKYKIMFDDNPKLATFSNASFTVRSPKKNETQNHFGTEGGFNGCVIHTYLPMMNGRVLMPPNSFDFMVPKRGSSMISFISSELGISIILPQLFFVICRSNGTIHINIKYVYCICISKWSGSEVGSARGEREQILIFTITYIEKEMTCLLYLYIGLTFL